MITLHPFQADLKRAIYGAWNAGAVNVGAVLATGGGKTVLFSDIVAETRMPSVVIAHRKELVGQTSLALVRNGVRHRVIGQKHLISWCQRQSVSEAGHNYVDPRALTAVASVDTLVRMSPDDPWMRSVRLWVCDEFHHLLADSKWGRAVAMFPNARGLGVSATPERADGQGLGRPDGLIDVLVEGPKMRELIRMGFLCDFRVFAPPSNLNLSSVSIAANGDFSPAPLRDAVHASHIVGDVVAHYLRLTPGQLGVTFCVDVAAAIETAAAYRQAGVLAEVVTGVTPPDVRSVLMRRFARGDFRQLCVVDIVSEGTDIPAIDVVSLARPSQSYSLVAQQIGRSLRTRAGKTLATVIDHVGNVERFARAELDPDTQRWVLAMDRLTWTLARRDRRSRSTSDKADALTVCPSCLRPYAAVEGRTCPYCGQVRELAGRSTPELVEGDLTELDPAVLRGLVQEIARIDGPARPPEGLPIPAIMAIEKRHAQRQMAQNELREAMALWGGARTGEGWGLSQAQRMFFCAFGIDVATAQTLGASEAKSLAARVARSVGRPG